MPQKTNLNVAPYYDDFAQDKNFYKVLFRPGYSIQARELTQLQSILQNQIESFGKYAFKQGELVIPGEVGLNTKLPFVKLSSVSEIPTNVDGQVVYKKYDITQLKGEKLKGLTSGVIATVIDADIATETASDVVYVNYTTSGDAGNEISFRQGETLEVVDGVNTPLLVVGTDGSVLPTTISVVSPDTRETASLESPAMGYASAVKVEEGIYFVNGYFVRNSEQLLIVDKYYNKPSSKIGFKITESLVSAESDESLFDNAIGSTNYSAPGANRLKIDLTLVKYGYTATTDKNFIQLLTVKSGSVQSQVTQTDYNLLEKTLARRTYDESGDYVVDSFSLDVREYYQQGGNLGIYPADEFGSVNGLTAAEAQDKLVASVGPGKAYVKGFEIVNKETKYLPINKARETLDRSDVRLKTSGLPTYRVNNTFGTVPLNAEGAELTAYPNVFLCSNFNDGTIGLNGTETEDADKQTLDRRGQYFDLDTGIKTIYIELNSSYDINSIGGASAGPIGTFISNGVADGNRTTGTYNGVASTTNGSGTGATFDVVVDGNGLPSVNIANAGSGYAFGEIVTISDSVLGGGGGADITLTVNGISGSTDTNDKRLDALSEIWYVISHATASTPKTVGSVKTIGLSVVNRVEVDPGTGVFLELTITGNKENLDKLFVEYDNADTDKEMKIFLTKTLAEGNNLTPLGHIVDYNETITPIIGIAKPSNVTLLERGNGFNPDIDVVASKGRQDNGDPVYNSTFGLSYFDPQFFTKILLDSSIPTGGFNTGEYVYGLQSGAYGVIEGASGKAFSKHQTLMVKTLFGTFRSGEPIKDESSNILRIAKDNTISHFIVNKRGQGYIDGTYLRIDGVDFDISKIKLSLSGLKLVSATIANRDLVNTEYSKPPVVNVIQGTGGSAVSNGAVVTPVLVRNSVTTYTPQNVKSFFSEYGSGNANKYTADIEVNKEKYAEVKSVTNFTFSGVKGKKFIECNGFGGDSTKVLQQGDLIQFTDTTDITRRAIVQQATKPSGVQKSRVYLDRSLPSSVSNSSVVRVRPAINNFNQGTLLFKTGTNQISSIVANSLDSKISYYLRRDFVRQGSGLTNGGFSFAAQLEYGTQRFVSFSESNFLVTVIDPGVTSGTSLISKGDVIYITSEHVSIASSVDSASGLTSGSVTLNLPDNYFGPASSTYSEFPTLKLTATLEVTKAKPRLKTSITNKRIVIDSIGDSVIPFRGTDYDTTSVNVYSYADAYKLRYVYMGSSTDAPVVDKNGVIVTGTDVTNRFTFDNGQRDTVYDISRLVLKPGEEAPTGRLVVAFDYFEHTAGDFCTVDSYLHEAGVSSGDIPSYNSPALGNISLKDVLDFRPKVDNDTIVSGFNNNSLLGSANTRSFSGGGGVVSSTPAPDSNLEYTFSFTQKQYLDRIDGIFLNNKGQFIIKEGNSSLNPSKPDPVSDAIALSYLYIPAYTESGKDVRITPVDNKRYTMRDIGKLEKRIERLEYYTVLSVLEQQALNMQVIDASGSNRFKSGFIVDNFEAHKIGALTSLDYKCAIDTQQSVMRAESKEDSFKLEEINNRDDQRSISGYNKTGDVISLPYTDLNLLGNSFATRTINPNPFVVLQYVGDSFIGPNVDSWYDNSTAPLVTDNNTNLYSIFLAKSKVRNAFASLYNSYKVNWIGANRSFFNLGSFADTNSNLADSSVTNASVSSSSNISPQNNEIGKGISTKGVGSNVVSTSLSFFARSIPVKFVINRLKPNTRVYVFMEGQNIARWVNPDTKYTGIAGNSLSAFNGSITTDANGNASGIILVPSGKAPRENTSWTGDVGTVSYDDSSNEVRFTTGIKTIRFTSSSTDSNKENVETYAEVKYYATGLVPENPSSIISTSPAFFKSNEGTQVTDSNTDNPIRPNPLAQTFKVENFDGGVFTTGIDLFFNKKSTDIPIRVYLTDVDNSKPGKNIIPGTQKVITPDTYLRVIASATLSVTRGEKVTGSSSNASGPISKIFDKNNIEVIASADGVYNLTSDQVYTFALDNHNGVSFHQDENLSIPSLIVANNANNTTNTVKISKDSGRVTDLKITNTGSSYDSAIITIESPQNPGGGTATATVRVSGGKVYYSELVLSGSEYTEPPAVVIAGTGTGNAGAVIESVITIDSPAVRMGVAVDDTTGSVVQSTTPTRFTFDHPVYLQNDTEYSLVLETDSIDYLVWASKLGETEIATSTTVTSQPALGSLFKSQNTNAWTEDLFEDLKFTLYRAEFDITRSAELLLTNENTGFETLDVNPIVTNASAESGATSSLFKNNNYKVKVHHPDNGFDVDGDSYVFFKGSTDVGGITASSINSTLYQVTNTGVDNYVITSSTRASSNSIGGGTNVLASYNRKFEKIHAIVPNLSFTQTSIDASIKTTNIKPVDDNVGTFTSYSQSDYEKTFLNEDFFFINQKVIASRINESVNNIDRSLTYKINLTSTVSHLSPIIDLSKASIKTISNRVENPNGQEDRFGRRDQILEFYPVYQFTVENTHTPSSVGSGNPTTINAPGTSVATLQTITGVTSNASGYIVKVVGSELTVNLKTTNVFQPGETLKFGDQTYLNDTGTEKVAVAVTNDILEKVPNFPKTVAISKITARSSEGFANTYDNKIDAAIVLWDSKAGKLSVTNNKQPIDNDYTSVANSNTALTRNANVDSQGADIFRVGDFISYTGQDANEVAFIQVSNVSYTDGVDYISDVKSKDSSSIAKYVTKEVVINNPATGINVKITANTSDINNIGILYRIKKSSSQENFDDIEWVYFNSTGVPDVDVIATSENSVSGITEKQSSYQELTYSVEDLPEFSSFAVKIIMKSSNPAFVPKIQDLRAVASY